jgi:hypothetical protein
MTTFAVDLEGNLVLLGSLETAVLLERGDLVESVGVTLLEAWKTKGKRLSAEHRKKISDALRGRGTKAGAAPGRVASKLGPRGPSLGKDADGKDIRVGGVVRRSWGGDLVVSGSTKKGLKVTSLNKSNFGAEYGDTEVIPHDQVSGLKARRGGTALVTGPHPGKPSVPPTPHQSTQRGLKAGEGPTTEAFHSAYNSWASKLNPKEVAALKAYSSEGAESYKTVNPHLRHGTAASKKTSDMVTHLDSALARSRTPVALSVYRQVDLSKSGYDLDKLVPGTRLRDEGYGSTSVDPYSSFTGGAGGVRMKIAVPKGSRGAYIESVSSRGAEHEFLLPRGYTLEVVGRSKTSYGVTELDVRLVGPSTGLRTRRRTAVAEAESEPVLSGKFTVTIEDFTVTPPGDLSEALLDTVGRTLQLLEKWKTKGKPLTAEHKKKISDALKGRKSFRVAAYEGGAKGAGTGKSALAKAHPVGSRVRTKDGSLEVTGHTSGYVGVKGGKKKWYRLDELQGMASPKVATKSPGSITGTHKTKAKVKADDLGPPSPTTPPGGWDKPYPRPPRKDQWHAEAEEAWKGVQAESAQFSKELSSKTLNYDVVRSNHEVREYKAAMVYSKALDKRNMAQYEEDIAAGIKRDKPVTSKDLLEGAKDFTKLDTSTYDVFDHPEFKAFTKGIEESGVGEWIRTRNKKNGVPVFTYFTGRYPGSAAKELGYDIDAGETPKGLPGHDPASSGSPKAWAEATRKRGWLREMYEAREAGMSLREYRLALDDRASEIVEGALSSGGMFIRANPTTISKVLTGGGFLTQHETQPNKETTHKRARMEAAMFGTPWNKGDHPTYGYVSGDPLGRVTKNSAASKGNKKLDDMNPGELDWLDGYGAAAIKLKTQTVRPKATLTHGDTMDIVGSLFTSGAVPATKPGGSMFSRQIVGNGNAEIMKNARERSPLRFKDADGDLAHEVGSWGARGYIEMQVHSKVTPADIEKVIFPKKPSAAVLKALKEAGIPWELIPE